MILCSVISGTSMMGISFFPVIKCFSWDGVPPDVSGSFLLNHHLWNIVLLDFTSILTYSCVMNKCNNHMLHLTILNFFIFDIMYYYSFLSSERVYFVLQFL